MARAPAITVEQMNEEARRRLLDGIEGKGAHLSFENAIAGFPDRLMNEKPPHVPYTFWHQLEHIRRAQEDMLSYIRNPEYVSPEWPRDFWPAPDETTDRQGWDRTVQGYLDHQRRYVDFLSDPALNLLAPVAHVQDRSVMRSTLIIIDHNAYHLGEFVMGRQILGAWKSNLAG